MKQEKPNDEKPMGAVDVGAVLATLVLIFSIICKVLIFGDGASSPLINIVAFCISLFAGTTALSLAFIVKSKKMEFTAKNMKIFLLMVLGAVVFSVLIQLFANYLISLLLIGLLLIMPIITVRYWHNKFTIGGLALLLFFDIGTTIAVILGLINLTGAQ